MADDDDFNEVDDESPSMRLYVARWPDGTAMLISAESMADVAGRLDEVGDPGTCEVVPLRCAVALVVRPRKHPTGSAYLDASLDALDDSIEVQTEIMVAAFPALHELIKKSRDDNGFLAVSRKEWSAAVAREVERKLAPSTAWADAIKDWWEEMSGAPADRSAAARDRMRITIPGEPTPDPSMRAHFEAEHRRIRKRIDDALGLDEVRPPVRKPKAAKPPARKRTPPRGRSSGRSGRSRAR